MTDLSQYAAQHQTELTALADRTSRNVLRLWRDMGTADMDAGWDAIAPQVNRVMSNAQVSAATAGGAYAGRALRMQDVQSDPVKVVPQAFAGVTREGRSVVPELFSAVTTVKGFIGRGVGVPAAFQAGAGFMAVMAANIIHDTGRSAASTGSVPRGAVYSVRVVQPGACSRCVILAGVKGYREDFQRHPRCRCTSMPLTDSEAPAGFFRSPDDYFDSLSKSEQDRVFSNAGAEAIRLGADPVSVVNARRGAYGIGYNNRGVKWRPGDPLGRLHPLTIGHRPDGSPLQVFATTEGTTARSSFARQNGRLVKGGDRYRRTTSVRLMPEQIITMSQSPGQARELLKKYGYLY